MSVNRDTSLGQQFHDGTKYWLVDNKLQSGPANDMESSIWQEDMSIEPRLFKSYSQAESIALPSEFEPLTMPMLEAIAQPGPLADSAMPTLESLARICLLSNGILKIGSHGTGRVIPYRAAGCTGARYHLELYLITGAIEGLDAGVYHYDAEQHTLRVLRRGDYRAAIVEASGNEPSLAAAPVIMAASSTFWRNAWRYKARAYRHVWWDLGSLTSNILAVAAASDLSTRVVMGFVDDDVNAVLGIDGQRESTVCLIPLGNTGTPAAATTAEPINPETVPVSSSEVMFPLLQLMNDASRLLTPTEAAEWRSQQLLRTPPQPTGEPIPFPALDAASCPDMPVDEAIRRRRSTRHYDVDQAIDLDAVSTLLQRSTRGFALDCVADGAPLLVDPYIIVNNVESLEQGSYAYYPESAELEQLRSGDQREAAYALASGQTYAGEAQVNLYYLADLEPILETYGNRGYRVAQFQAGLNASRLHLATHAFGLGAVGSTSVDGAVSAYFSPHAAGASYLFVLTFGKRRRRDRP